MVDRNDDTKRKLILEKKLYYAVLARDSWQVKELVNCCDGTFRDANGSIIAYLCNRGNHQNID